MNTFKQHQDMVERLVKPGSDIYSNLDPYRCDLLHAVLGIAGEAGELVDAVKKHVIYNKPLDQANVIEELGDLEFYMEQLRQRLGVTREYCLQNNIDKLSVRYQNLQYSDEQAYNRRDKQTPQ
jgi:NTP pyrophosphatase (non-canonical NTP hydrolase)